MPSTTTNRAPGMAAATDRPDRVIGWHWASPAPVMKLAEIVVTPETSEATIATVVDAGSRAGYCTIRIEALDAKGGLTQVATANIKIEP